MLAAAVSARLRKHGFRAGCVGITLKDSKFNTMTRQQTLAYPANDAGTVFNTAYALFAKNFSWQNNLRAVGIRADGLSERGTEQISMLDKNECSVIINLDERVKSLVARYGALEVEKTATMRG
jgi:DNA polymerase-4